MMKSLIVFLSLLVCSSSAFSQTGTFTGRVEQCAAPLDFCEFQLKPAEEPIELIQFTGWNCSESNVTEDVRSKLKLFDSIGKAEHAEKSLNKNDSFDLRMLALTVDLESFTAPSEFIDHYFSIVTLSDGRHYLVPNPGIFVRPQPGPGQTFNKNVSQEYNKDKIYCYTEDEFSVFKHVLLHYATNIAYFRKLIDMF